MQTEIGNLKDGDGLSLHTVKWLPDGDGRGIVVIAHGIGEHSGRYKHIAQRLTQHDYIVASFDYRGHGRSEGKRVHIEDFDQYVSEIGLFIDHIESAHPDLPIVLYGHSMGALNSLLYVHKNQHRLQGWIASGIPLTLEQNAPALVIRLVQLLIRVLPGLRAIPLEHAALSRDPAVVTTYRADPLIYSGLLPVRIASEHFLNTRKGKQLAEDIHLPVLILHGAADRICPSSGSQLLFEMVSSDDKQLQIYEGLFHEIHNEPEQDKVLSDIVNWLEQH